MTQQNTAPESTPKSSAKSSPRSNKEPLHPEEVVTPVWFVRHGHTGATEQGILNTDPTAELTDNGKKQALAAGHWLKEQAVDVLLSSSSKRVLTTAEIIADVIEVPLLVVNDLNEWNVGEWEGRAYVDIKADDPDLYKAWVHDPIFNKPPGGDTFELYIGLGQAF